MRRRVYGKTRAEVETKIVELRSKEQAGIPLTPSHLTLEAYLERVADSDRECQGSPQHAQGLQFHIDRYLIPDLGAKKLGQLYGA